MALTINGASAKPRILAFSLHGLTIFKPSRCIEASFYTIENILDFFTANGFNFLQFITHIKSSLLTTSRELRQQFAACSG